MNDLRREIKHGFAQQQAQLGDVAATTDRILRQAVPTRRRTSQLWPSMAGVALVLVAAIAVATSVVVRGLNPRSVTTHRPTPTPTVQVTPSPTAMSNLLQVPSTTPVIVFRDPVDANQVDAITWDGSASGHVAPNAQTGTGFATNPQASLFGTPPEIVDRSGSVVATVPNPTKGFQATWSDDGQHYCTMVSASAFGQTSGVPTTLQVVQVGKSPRNVVQVGRLYEQTFVRVAACSMATDQAVVVQSSGQGIGTVQWWVVRISTGRILFTKAYPGGASEIEIRASIDGQYIAEAASSGSPLHGESTTIYSPTGAVLGHVNGAVQGFSWDGSLAIVADYGGPVSIIRWRDGTKVWTSAPDARYAEAIAEPGGQRIAVSLLDPNHPQTGGFPPIDIDVVSPDGKAVRILTNVFE